MSEIRYEDGSNELKSHEEIFGKFQKEVAPKIENLMELLMQRNVKSVTLHKPGEIVEKDGKLFMVTESGDWRECVKMADGAIYLIGENGKLILYQERDV